MECGGPAIRPGLDNRHLIWDSVGPSPSPFPKDFGFWIWNLDLGPGYGTWIRDLDLGQYFGLTKISDYKMYLFLLFRFLRRLCDALPAITQVFTYSFYQLFNYSFFIFTNSL